MPAVTGRAKTHPQFPVPAVTGRKKACEDNHLSYPPWRYFAPPIVLSLFRTNKPMRLDFLSIVLEDFRGPRKTVFRLKIMRSKSAGNHGAWQDKSTNFQGLVFIPNREIASLAFKMKRTNRNWCLGGLRMEDQGERNPQTFLFSIPRPRQKQGDRCVFKRVLNVTDSGFEAAAWS